MATTAAMKVGHHSWTAKNIVVRSPVRRPSRQPFLADAPMAIATPPNTIKQAAAPATLPKLMANGRLSTKSSPGHDAFRSHSGEPNTAGVPRQQHGAPKTER